MTERTERERNLDQIADFWIIWSPQGIHAPKFKHFTLESAEREAERLAATNPGKQFFVMEPRYEVAALLTRIRHAPDEVPF